MRTVNDIELPKLRDAEAYNRRLLHACNADTIFRSRRAQWVNAHPFGTVTGLDFLQAVLAPARNAGTTPESFPNFNSHVAWVLSLPTPAPPRRPFPAIVRNADGNMAVVEQE